jgi:hypothetical protein
MSAIGIAQKLGSIPSFPHVHICLLVCALYVYLPQTCTPGVSVGAQDTISNHSLERHTLMRANFKSTYACTHTQVPEVAAAEIRALIKEKERLETNVEEAREENEGLVIMVAVQHLRLMLANWRRPLYCSTLRSRLEEARAVEDAERRMEDEMRREKSDVGQTDHALFHAGMGNTRSPRKQHMMLTSYERRNDLTAPSPPSSGGPKHSAFSPNQENTVLPPSGASTMMSGATTAWAAASGGYSLAHTDSSRDELAQTQHVHAFSDDAQVEGAVSEYEDIRRMRALNEGRAKYKAENFDQNSHRFGTDGFHPHTPPLNAGSPDKINQMSTDGVQPKTPSTRLPGSSPGGSVAIDWEPVTSKIVTPQSPKSGGIDLNELDLSNHDKLIEAYDRPAESQHAAAHASPDALSTLLLSGFKPSHYTPAGHSTQSPYERTDAPSSERHEMRRNSDGLLPPRTHIPSTEQNSISSPRYSVHKGSSPSPAGVHHSPEGAARSAGSTVPMGALDAYIDLRQHHAVQDGLSLGQPVHHQHDRSPTHDDYHRSLESKATPQTMHANYGDLLPTSVHSATHSHHYSNSPANFDDRAASSNQALSQQHHRQHSSPSYVTPHAAGTPQASSMSGVVSSAGRNDLFGASNNPERHMSQAQAHGNTPKLYGGDNYGQSQDSRSSTPSRPATPGTAARSVSEYKAIAAKADAEIAALQSLALKRYICIHTHAYM